MEKLKVKTDPKFLKYFNEYPPVVKKKMHNLRKLVHEVAYNIECISELEETLKWGEPSFLTKNGSTLRIDWKERSPNQYAVYFKCTTKLVPTFKRIFNNKFRYEKDRALIFNLTEQVPTSELKQCIAAALKYHNVKHLKNLGIKGENL